MPTYLRSDVTFEKGQGVWLWDNHNKRYLDAIAGIAVCNLGHAHPAVHESICQQSKKLLHTSNLYHIDVQEKLAERLIAKSGLDNAFFCNSGAEANEAAIKIARLYGKEKNIQTPTIITMKRSFHGRTMATLSATGNEAVQTGFSPLLDGFIHVEYNQVQVLENQIEQNPNIVAIMLEPVQGEGGVNIPAPDYLNQIRQLCDKHELLMILDEIQTGIGRTGKFLSYQHNQILPDVCTLAKALGNGLPIGACLARGKASKLLSAGKHGSTFGGNPLACQTALTVINTLETELIIEQVEEKAQHFVHRIEHTLSNNPQVVDIRNKGLMIGIELEQPCRELVGIALDQGLLINVAGEKTIRLLPPLIIDKTQLEELADRLSNIITEFTAVHE